MIIRSCTFDEILAVHAKIPEMQTIENTEYFVERIGSKRSISLAAEVSGAVAGYKLGYWLDSEVFYSWLGGVIPGQRKQGIAKALLNRQEAEVQSAGGKKILVKSMNKYPGMLVMLISNAYQVIGYERPGQVDGKIEFSKSLV